MSGENLNGKQPIKFLFEKNNTHKSGIIRETVEFKIQIIRFR